MSASVVFDLGGVLCHLCPERRLAALAAETGLDARRIERKIWGSGLDERAERGELTHDETVAAVLDALDHRIREEALFHAWARAFEPDDRVLEVLKRCRTRRYVFTNNGPILRDCLDSEITTQVDRVICSYELLARKPEIVAFERLAIELDADPPSITFIDDNEDNCESARLAGFRVVHFIDAESLSSTLEDFGLLLG